jgi:hypothetical protein
MNLLVVDNSYIAGNSPEDKAFMALTTSKWNALKAAGWKHVINDSERVRCMLFRLGYTPEYLEKEGKNWCVCSEGFKWDTFTPDDINTRVFMTIEEAYQRVRFLHLARPPCFYNVV